MKPARVLLTVQAALLALEVVLLLAWLAYMVRDPEAVRVRSAVQASLLAAAAVWGTIVLRRTLEDLGVLYVRGPR